jgi:hypothetical protein
MQAVKTAGQAATRPLPIGVLAGLTGAVLLAHLLLLQYTPAALGISEPVRTRVFTTRSLQINAPTPQPAVPAAPPKPHPAVQAPAAAVRDKAPPRRSVAAVEAQRAAPRVEAEVHPAAVDTSVPASAEPVATSSAATASEPASAAADIAPIPVAQAAPAIATPPAPAVSAASAPPAGAPLPKDPAQIARSYTVPGSVRLQFNATGQRAKMNYFAAGELLWLLRDDNSYDARMEISAFLIGARVYSSTGRITADGLAPTRFSDKFRSEQAAHFERDKGRVTFSSNAPESALLPGAQDQLSVFVQLASMIAGEPLKYPAGTGISIQTVGPRSAETWVFTVTGTEQLFLPGGELTALKLTRNPRKEYDQKVEIWLAPALAYLPARIRITQANGDFVDQQWRSTATP